MSWHRTWKAHKMRKICSLTLAIYIILDELFVFLVVSCWRLFFLIQYFPKKNIIFSKVFFFLQMNHMQIFFPCQYLCFCCWFLFFFFGWERGENISCSRFFSNASNIAVHLFGWYDLCIIWCTYE